MAPKLFTRKIRDLAVARVVAKDQIVGRVMYPRDAMAGTTPKWECFIMDGVTMKDILLVEAFGAPLIKKCKGELKDKKVVAIRNYQIVAKGKAMTFANRPLKLSIKSDAAIAEQADDQSLPAQLPTVSLDAVDNLAGGCLISLLVVTKTQGAAMERDTYLGKKLVCNCDVMAAGSNIAFAAWGSFATFMADQPLQTALRCEAVLAKPQDDGVGVKLTTLDCSRLHLLVGDEARQLLDALPPDGETKALSTAHIGDNGPSVEALLNAPCDIVDMCLVGRLVSTVADPSDPGGSINGIFEVPAVILQDIRGGSLADDSSDSLLYTACSKCFKKMADSHSCPKCGTADTVTRHLAHVTVSDPTGSVEATVYHDAVATLLQAVDVEKDASGDIVPTCGAVLAAGAALPLVVRIRVKPNSYKPGTHMAEILGFKSSWTDAGILNVYRASPVRLQPSGAQVPPVIPNDVEANMLEQMLVHKHPCQYFRLLVDITSKRPDTESQPDVDGMTCKRVVQCAISKQSLILTQSGSLDAIHAFYSLQQKSLVSAVCSAVCDVSKDGAPTVREFLVAHLHVVSNVDTDAVRKVFKFELAEVVKYFSRAYTKVTDSTPQQAKRSATEGGVGSSPGWPSPKRRLQIRATDEAAACGLGESHAETARP